MHFVDGFAVDIGVEASRLIGIVTGFDRRVLEVDSMLAGCGKQDRERVEAGSRVEGFGCIGCNMRAGMKGIGRLTSGLVYVPGWS